MKQFYAVWYGLTVVAQILASVDTTESEARSQMINNLWGCPGVYSVSGFTPIEMVTMIHHGQMRIYPIPKCETPDCLVCQGTTT